MTKPPMELDEAIEIGKNLLTLQDDEQISKQGFEALQVLIAEAEKNMQMLAFIKNIADHDIGAPCCGIGCLQEIVMAAKNIIPQERSEIHFERVVPSIVLPTPEELAKKIHEIEGDLEGNADWEILFPKYKFRLVEAASRLLTWMREQR